MSEQYELKAILALLLFCSVFAPVLTPGRLHAAFFLALIVVLITFTPRLLR